MATLKHFDIIEDEPSGSSSPRSALKHFDIIEDDEPEKHPEAGDGILDALHAGVYSNALGMTAGGIEALERSVGLDSGADYWKGLKQKAEAKADSIYSGRPDTGAFLDEVKEGDWKGAATAAAYGIAENLAGVVPQAALMLAPGGLAANLGKTLLTGGYTAAQTFGDMESTQREKGVVDEKGNVQLQGTDYAIGAGSAFLDTLTAGAGGLKGAGNFLKRMAAESAQEGTQEVGMLGSAHIKGADVTADEYATNFVEGAVIGPGTRATIEVTPKLAGAVKRSVQGIGPEADVMKNLDEDDANLVERFRRHTAERPKVIGDLDPIEGIRPVAVAVRDEIKTEGNQIIDSLKKLMEKKEASPDEMNRLQAAKTIFGKRTAGVTQAVIDDVTHLADRYGSASDGARIHSLAKQMHKADQFSVAGGEIGGLSQYTRKADPFDKSNSSLTHGQAMTTTAIIGGMTGLGVGGPMGAILGASAGIIANKAAHGLDVMTNRRSRIKRYINKVEAKGLQPTRVDGMTSAQLLQTMQRQKKAQKATRKQPFQQDPAIQAKMDAEREAQWAPVMQSGVIPDTKSAKGLRYWRHFTGGATPQQILQVLSQINPEYAQDYSRGASKLGKLPIDDVGALQGAVRRAYNLQEPSEAETEAFYAREGEAKRARKEAKKGGSSPYDFTPSGKRGQFKGQLAHRIAVWLLDRINNSDFDATEKTALIRLVHNLNRPDMAKDDRRTELNRVLNEVFPETSGVRLAIKGKLAVDFSNLVEIGNDQRIYKDDDGTEVMEEPEVAKERKESKAPVKQEPEPVTETEAEESKAGADKRAEDRVDPPVEPKPVPAEPQKVETPAGKTVRAAARKASGNVGSKVKTVVDLFQTLVKQSQVAQSEAPTYQAKLDQMMATGNKTDQVVVAASTIEGQLTQVAITEKLARLYNEQFADPTDPDTRYEARDLAALVDAELNKLEEAGQITRKYTQMTKDGKQVKSQKKGGKYLSNVEIMPVEGTMFGDLISTGHAIRKMADMVDISQPSEVITPEALEAGMVWKKDHKSTAEDAVRYAPLIDFINTLKGMEMQIDQRLMDQVAAAIDAAAVSNNKNNQLLNALLPKKNEDSNARAFTQLLFQQERYGGGTAFYQDFTAQKSGRVTAHNGSASSHAGDFMKAVLRSPVSQSMNTEDNLRLYFQSFGNLLGVDKEAPSIKRTHIITERGLVEDLLALAKKPHQEVTRESRKTAGRIRTLVESGEGFFQTLNVANELTDLTNFIKGRPQHKALFDAKGEPKGKWADVLSDPSVVEDVMKNYKTDYIIQLDANNNSFQLAGLMIGDPETLMRTGMMQRPGVDPDTAPPADVYVEPAQRVAAQIPELTDVPPSKLRKLFKRAISTYIYGAEFTSRKKAFRDGFADAGGIGYDDKSGIKLNKELHDQMAKGEPIPNWDGSKEAKIVPHQMTDKKGVVHKGYALVQRNVPKRSAPKPWPAVKKTAAVIDKETLIQRYQENQLISNMNSKLVRDLQSNFGRLQEYMNFANNVVKAIKERGGHTIKIPTKDGMVLTVDLKESPLYAPFEPSAYPGKNIGFKIGNEGYSGKPVAALMAHQNDAYVLRNTLKEAMARPEGIGVYNTIHDSHGFGVGDVAAGQKIILETMKSLGAETYNIFDQILELNGLKGKVEAPARIGVDDQIDIEQIPTAVS